MTDPETQKPKGFGFCEFEDAEGVLRALRLLNGLKIDGQELLLKANTATQKYIEYYEEQKAAKKAEADEKPAADAGEAEAGGEPAPAGTEGEGAYAVALAPACKLRGLVAFDCCRLKMKHIWTQRADMLQRRCAG